MAIKVQGDLVIDNNKDFTGRNAEFEKHLEAESGEFEETVTSRSTVDGDTPTTLVTKDYLEANIESHLIGGDGIALDTDDIDTTVEVDLGDDAFRTGLEFDANDKLVAKIADRNNIGSVKIGGGLKIDKSGLLSTDIADQVTIRGTVDLTKNNVEGLIGNNSVEDGDAFVNSTTGDIHPTWESELNKAPDPNTGENKVEVGDMIIKTATGFVYIGT